MMNSEVGEWFTNFTVTLFIKMFLKSLPTSVEVDNRFAIFNPVEFSNWFAEFIIKVFFRSRQPSPNLVHMNSANGLPSLTLNSILKNQHLNIQITQWSRHGACRLHYVQTRQLVCRVPFYRIISLSTWQFIYLWVKNSKNL